MPAAQHLCQTIPIINARLESRSSSKPRNPLPFQYSCSFAYAFRVIGFKLYQTTSLKQEHFQSSKRGEELLSSGGFVAFAAISVSFGSLTNINRFAAYGRVNP